jgi:hypothetical protein
MLSTAHAGDELGWKSDHLDEMDGGDRKKVVGRLKDDPRQLGKG